MVAVDSSVVPACNTNERLNTWAHNLLTPQHLAGEMRRRAVVPACRFGTDALGLRVSNLNQDRGSKDAMVAVDSSVVPA